jgi:hypothetical protein
MHTTVHFTPDLMLNEIKNRVHGTSSTITCEALFTSKVFEGMGGDYFVSRNFLDRLFTSPGFEGIIPRYLHNSSPL